MAPTAAESTDRKDRSGGNGEKSGIFGLSGLVIQLKPDKVWLVIQLGHPRKDKTAQDTNK